MTKKKSDTGSFRDPSGFIFYANGILFRQVNTCYKEQYDLLMSSGLYDSLVEDNLLISHKEMNKLFKKDDCAYKIIQPEKIDFVSYPYEWCFSQLKDAALLTLEIQKKAMEKGMCLKDASAYNIQFLHGKPIFIDTLSFDILKKGAPWVAYKQFCQHFLAPLALQSYTDVRLNSLTKCYIDGLPLDLVNKLLPFKSNFSFGIFSHILLHSKSQQKYGGKNIDSKKYSTSMSENSLLGLVDSLESTIKNLKLNLKGTEWEDYYVDNNNYSSESFDFKMQFVMNCVNEEKPFMVWDIGANDGKFSELAAKEGCCTISMDIDPVCVERNYLQRTSTGIYNMLPLIFDITNPSPGIGWDNTERKTLFERGPADMVLALALVHHLAISNNLPLRKIAEYFEKIARTLVIEFVPKTDSQVKKLLSSREDIFQEYTIKDFEKEFSFFFTIENSQQIVNSERTIYFMRNKK